MTTLILPPRYSDDSNALWRAAIELGWNIERLQSWRVPASFHPGLDVTIYGESLLANFVAEQLGLCLYEPPLDWLAKLSPTFLGRKVDFGTLAEVRQKSFPLFVKPAGEKSFEARLYSRTDDLPPAHDDVESVPVLCSEPVEWMVEYRFFVLNDHIATGSSYWCETGSTRESDGSYRTTPAEMDAAREFVEHLLASDAGSFGEFGSVIDVGYVRGFGWAVVEANPAWGAGIYGCDPKKVLEVISKCVYPRP